MEVDKIINLDASQLKTKKTGEKIVTKLQQWLLSKTEPDLRAVLPEDKIQRLLVGVSKNNFYNSLKSQILSKLSTTIYSNVYFFQACNQLEIATHIEMTASLLQHDANNIIKTALAGTQTKKFTDVMEAAFGGDDRPVSAPTDESEEEEEEEPEATAEPGTSTLSKTLK